jgi:hypothetical protein
MEETRAQGLTLTCSLASPLTEEEEEDTIMEEVVTITTPPPFITDQIMDITTTITVVLTLT